MDRLTTGEAIGCIVVILIVTLCVGLWSIRRLESEP